MKTIVYFLLISLASFGQKQGNIWYFGDKAGLNFNTNPPTPLLNGQTDFNPPSQLWNEGCSSVSDSSGSLLFYSNGVTVWNKIQGIMPNGTGLAGHKSSTQSCIIVPKPGSDQFFYVFTCDAYENQFKNGLRYSIVDICLDGGKGDVTGIKNVPLVDTTSEKAICVKHTNGTDYWIITHKYLTNSFYSFQLTSAGITNTVISSTGAVDLVGWGQMVASPNGLKLAYNMSSGVTSQGKCLLLDFNPSTGAVTNGQTLASGGREWGASFSPDNSKLYFSTLGFGSVFQYDVNAGNLAAIIASKNYIITTAPDSWRHHQLGPDGKIYISRTGKKFLSVINNPNSICPACNYIDSAIYLGGKNASFGLPSFITGYQYSNTVVPLCASGINSWIKESNLILAYPNPNNGVFTLRVDIEIEKGGIILFNSLGQKIYEQKIIPGTNEIKTSGLPVGLYNYILLQDNQTISNGKLTIE